MSVDCSSCERLVLFATGNCCSPGVQRVDTYGGSTSSMHMAQIRHIMITFFCFLRYPLRQSLANE